TGAAIFGRVVPAETKKRFWPIFRLQTLVGPTTMFFSGKVKRSSGRPFRPGRRRKACRRGAAGATSITGSARAGRIFASRTRLFSLAQGFSSCARRGPIRLFGGRRIALATSNDWHQAKPNASAGRLTSDETRYQFLMGGFAMRRVCLVAAAAIAFLGPWLA